MSFHIILIPARGQGRPSPGYPQGYFRNPLDIPMSLSGNFGELRPNHFHMGLDIKTMARVNLPVYAAADGYVARIKIEPFGFGRAIYINHPNGFTTLYAHLNDFSPQIEAYLKQQQYQQESWKILIDVPPNLLVLKKGDFIANSGTTGGSQAPHLHFEVRRTADDVNLNPMLFGFPVADQTKPVILRLAVYDRKKSTHEQSPKIIAVKNSANGYVTVPTVVPVSSGRISFAITAYDTHTGSTNLNGIYHASIYDNGRLLTSFVMDNISYNETRYINAHIDYKTKATAGPYLQHLSVLPGYVNSIYSKTGGDGVIDVSDSSIHQIRIIVKDTYNNTSELNCAVQLAAPSPKASAVTGRMFYPMMIDIMEFEDCEFYMGEKCLYDSVHIRYGRAVSTNANVLSAIHTIGPTYIPLQDFFVVRIKPIEPLVPGKKERIVMQRFSGSKQEIQKVQWQDGWASARFRDFGNFQLVLDEEPPTITPIGTIDGANLSKAPAISFLVRDNLQNFKNFRAELNGKWLRFTNDKEWAFTYRFDERCPPGEHELKIYVEDEAGNPATKTFQFTR
jgi:murein DD-endopeptidase MepM/ murein hydrolase activator NlpD